MAPDNEPFQLHDGLRRRAAGRRRGTTGAKLWPRRPTAITADTESDCQTEDEVRQHHLMRQPRDRRGHARHWQPCQSRSHRLLAPSAARRPDPWRSDRSAGTLARHLRTIRRSPARDFRSACDVPLHDRGIRLPAASPRTLRPVSTRRARRRTRRCRSWDRLRVPRAAQGSCSGACRRRSGLGQRCRLRARLRIGRRAGQRTAGAVWRRRNQELDSRLREHDFAGFKSR